MSIITRENTLVLTTFEAGKENIQSYADLCEKWKEVACAKKKEASQKEIDIFADSEAVIDQMRKELISKVFAKNVYVAKDSEGEVQGLCIAEKTVVSKTTGDRLGVFQKISYLATNPLNIKASCNKNEKKQVRGAATKLIEHIDRVAKKSKCKGIFLESVYSAKSFYKRQKFREHYVTEIQMSANNCFPMSRKCLTE